MLNVTKARRLDVQRGHKYPNPHADREILRLTGPLGRCGGRIPMPIRRNPDYEYRLPAANLTITDLERITASLMAIGDTVLFEANGYAFDELDELPNVPGPKNPRTTISGDPSGVRIYLGGASRILYYGSDPAVRDTVIRIRDDIGQRARFTLGAGARASVTGLQVMILAALLVIAFVPGIDLAHGVRLAVVFALAAANVAILPALILIPVPGKIRIERTPGHRSIWSRLAEHLVTVLVLTIGGVLAIGVAAYLGLGRKP